MSDNLPAPREYTPEGLPVVWDPFKNSAEFAVQTTYPVSTPEERSVVLDILEGEYVEANDVIGDVFEFSHYITHPVKLLDQDTGEMVDAIRTLLPQSNGPPIKFVSIGVLESINRIAWQQGKLPPYYPPILVKLKQQKVRNKGRTFKLVPFLPE